MGKEGKDSILKILNESRGFDIALMTTFNFEIPFFERVVLNTLYACDVNKVSVFVDSREFVKALNDVNNCHLGRKYMVNPIRLVGSFHPKVILLLGEKKARLIVSSANIKTSGYYINNEIFNYVDYSPNKTENLSLIVSAIDFFDTLNKMSYGLDSSLIEEAKEYIYYHSTEDGNDRIFLHNLNSSILSQLDTFIDEKIESIDIAVPYYDRELKELQVIKDKYKDAKINLFIQDGKSTFPKEFNENSHIIENIKVFDGFKDGNKNFYHGKVFLFKGESKSFILYGSANCTQAALGSTYSEAGNVECDFLDIGSIEEFDGFFENMTTVEGRNLETQKMIFKKSESNNCLFKYGNISKYGCELHFEIGEKTNLKEILVSDEKLEYSINDRELVVKIPEEILIDLSDVFDIIIRYEEKKEKYRCWAYDEGILNSNRNKRNEKYTLKNFDFDSDGSKYIEDRTNLINAEITCLPDMEEYEKNKAMFKTIEQQKEEKEETEEFNFVVDVEIPDEIRIAFKRHREVLNIRSKFFSIFLKRNSISNGEKSDGIPEDKDVEEFAPRPATSEEKRFERFVKNEVKGMIKSDFVSKVQLEHYIGLISVVNDIFNKYRNKSKVEGIFDNQYIAKANVDFAIRVLGKINEQDKNEEIEEAMLVFSLKTLINNYIYLKETDDDDKKMEIDDNNKKLLLTIEKMYSIRSKYFPLVYKITVQDKQKYSDLNIADLKDYIEHLYGYKNLELLVNYISSCYENAEVKIDNNKMTITSNVTSDKRYSQPNQQMIREIKNYSRCVQQIESVIIIINYNLDSTSNNKIRQVTHTVGLKYNTWRETIKYKNGNIWEGKNQYLKC